MYDFDAAIPKQRASYALRSEGYNFPEMPISGVRMSAGRFVRTERVIARAGLDHMLLSTYRSTDHRFVTAGNEGVARAGDVVAVDLTQPSSFAALEEDNRNISLMVPRRLLAPLLPDIEDRHGLVLPRGTPLNVLLRSHMKDLLAQARHLTPASALAVTRASAALVAACLGNADRSAPPGESARASLAAAIMRLIRQAIEEHLDDPELGPAQLCRDFKLSRARLYRLFEPLGGVRAYIQQRRLMRVHRILADPGAPYETIASLAERWGFPDHAAFSRTYRLAYGVTPSETRTLAQAHFAKARVVAAEAPENSFVKVNRWLYGIDEPPPDLA
jgi:AraC-like DNA-binding protein